MTFMVSSRAPTCAPWSGWIRDHLDQSPAAHTSRQRRLGSSYKTHSRAQRTAGTTSENVAALAAGEHACDAPMTHKRDGAAGVDCPSRRRPCCCRGLPDNGRSRCAGCRALRRDQDAASTTPDTPAVLGRTPGHAARRISRVTADRRTLERASRGEDDGLFTAAPFRSQGVVNTSTARKKTWDPTPDTP